MTTFKNFLTDETGASAAEYAIILAIVGAALITAIGTLGTNIGSAIDTVAQKIK